MNRRYSCSEKTGKPAEDLALLTTAVELGTRTKQVTLFVFTLQRVRSGFDEGKSVSCWPVIESKLNNHNRIIIPVVLLSLDTFLGTPY